MLERLEEVRKKIESLEMDFRFLKTIKTEMNGIERETWLLEYEGSQFVYVAGQKNVTLGWDVSKCSLGDGVLKGLQEEFEAGHEYYQQGIEEMQEDYQEQIQKAMADGDEAKAEELRAEFAEELKSMKEEISELGYEYWDGFISKWNQQLSECLSPLRTADIGDLIVETDIRFLEEDALSLSEVIPSLKKGPFTLATEDEWEYLCNGGARTLFRWGDTLEDVIDEIFHVGSTIDYQEQTSHILETPNMLGLMIAYDSYQMEIIDNTQFTKGGDGGCSLCGGDGAIYTLPCYTAFYRQAPYTSTLSNNYYCYRRILRLP